MKLEEQLRLNLVDFYNIPVPFWQKVLGSELHFHLGHFPSDDIALEQSMRLAIKHLIMQMPPKNVRRVLDVGCGWGGTAFQLVEVWNAEVLGITISKEQANFINEQAYIRKSPVRALEIDAEMYDFRGIGTFDVLWLYECLEHIADRRSLLLKLHNAASETTNLAITMHCRSPHIEKELLYNEFMGIQFLDSVPDLIKLLEETGWEIVALFDRTPLTKPVWKHWAEKLQQIIEPEFGLYANKLGVALANTEELYNRGFLQSVQIAAKCLDTRYDI
jgi:cyclopropane fatty-acyl-phospholipid synthase-like methyltransferase